MTGVQRVLLGLAWPTVVWAFERGDLSLCVLSAGLLGAVVIVVLRMLLP